MKLIGTLLVTAALTACANPQPIHNVLNAPIGKSMSLDEIGEKIRLAGTALGWQMQIQEPGRIYGRLDLRKHLAVVDIEYDTKQYSIKYRASNNLNAGNGMIHRNYNGWIQNLDKGIQTQLGL